MPVEIYQVSINVNVSSDEKAKVKNDTKANKKENQQMVQSCVEAVLSILEQKEDR